MCNDAAGYIPTPQAFRGGGYETETAAWSFLGPEALDRSCGQRAWISQRSGARMKKGFALCLEHWDEWEK
jgi:hypothetical protein